MRKMKNIYAFLISAFTFLLGSSQVIYTDVTPDLTYTITDSLNIDINNNGSVDVKIFAKNLSYTSALGYSISTNSIYTTNGWTRTAFLSTIDSSLSFGPFEWNNTSYYSKSRSFELWRHHLWRTEMVSSFCIS